MVMHHSITLANAPVVFIQYLVALAVVESVRTRKGYEDVPLRLKWPNDIYAEVKEKDEQGQVVTVLKKVGGLLVNSSFLKNEFLLVVGTYRCQANK
jgi:biotin--protein ligase